MSASKAKGSAADQLDPDDAGDRRLIKRQQDAARQAGRDRRDRAKTTRGRADLEAAYDAGAAEAAGGSDEGDEGTAKAEQPQAQKSAPATPAEKPAAGPGRGQRAWNGVNRGSWSAFKPTSPAKPPTRLSETGGFLTGVMVYTVVITYIRYGPAGWKGWLSAKFLNKPMTSSAATSAASGSSAPTAKQEAT